MGAGLNVGLGNILYNNTGTYATPVWTPIPIVQDATLSLQKDKAAAYKRGSKFKMNLAALRAAGIKFKMLADTSDTNYDVIKNAWVNDTVLDIAMSDQVIATTGAEYWRADYLVFGFERAEPLNDVDTVDVEIDLAYSVNAQGFTTVGS